MFVFRHAVMSANEKQKETDSQNGNKMKERLMTSEGPVSGREIKH